MYALNANEPNKHSWREDIEDKQFNSIISPLDSPKNVMQR